MIPKPLNDVQANDLLTLRDNQVPEGKTIEYKFALPGGTNDERKEFLKDVSSFANTNGGDLLYGVQAEGGVSQAFPGIGDVNEDELKLKLENMCRESIEPRLPKIEFRFVPIAQGRVLLIRVPKSWLFPHRVKFAGHGHFYERNSAGAFQMDVGELRTAFTLSQDIAERIRNFRMERLSKLHANDTPVPIKLGCRMAFHVVPLSAFSGSDKIDVSQHHELLRELRPLGSPGPDHNTKINLDGVLNYTNSDDGRSRAYTQVFRSGIIEAVAVFSQTQVDGVKRIHSKTFEHYLVNALPGYLEKLQVLDIQTPVFLFLSFVGTTGYVFSVPEGPGGAFGLQNSETDRDVLAPPEVVIPNYGMEAHKVLKPIFDMIWNAFGYPGSGNYNAAGNWLQ